MWARLSIVAGLVVGIAVAGLVLGGILAFAPDAPLPSAPSPAPVTGSPPAAASSAPSASAVSSASSTAAPTVSSSPVAAAAFHVGQPAPPLVVPKVGGGTIDLATLRGKPVWVNFMATWCPPCQDEFPLMNGFAARYASTGLVVLAVDIQENEGAVAAFAKQLGATFPLGLDVDGKAASAWDAIGLPIHFWIDADGIVRHGAVGGIGPDVMAAGLRTILPGVDVTP